MEYMIVHRGDTVYRIRFIRETDDLLYLETNISVFLPINGHESQHVMSWLEARFFEHYWEKDHD